MRIVLALLTSIVLIPVASTAQALQSQRAPSADAQAANKHYAQGWSAIRAESWSDAAREFQAAIDSAPKYALAYYALGRAEVGRRNFANAIAAYRKCKELYESSGAEGFTNQMEVRQRLNDRILEVQTAINQATSLTSSAKASSQTQSLTVRELQAQLQRLEQARDRNTNVSLEATPVPFFVPMSLGAAYFRSGQFANAEREYKAAIAANAASGETHNNLAVLYLTTDRYDEAEAEVRAAEKVGFRVNENLKGDIRKKKSGS
ncbi:MAG: tetratricopeptide repeat protein [Vicinamibacterales bacterium]